MVYPIGALVDLICAPISGDQDDHCTGEILAVNDLYATVKMTHVCQSCQMHFVLTQGAGEDDRHIQREVGKESDVFIFLIAPYDPLASALRALRLPDQPPDISTECS